MGGASPVERALVAKVLANTGGDVKRAAQVMGRSVRFIKRWSEAAAQGKGFKNKRGQGRKRILSPQAAGVAKQQALSKRKTCCKEIAKNLHKRGWVEKDISDRSVSRVLKSGCSRALKYKTQKKAQRLTKRQRAARLQWAQQVRQRPLSYWRGLMFTDSHMFRMHVGTRGRKRWCVPGKEVVVMVDKHPSVVHAYGGVTFNGPTSLQFVTGTTGLKTTTKGVSQSEYHEVISKTFIPEGKRLFDGRPFVVWQDGAPVHTAKSTKKYWSSFPGATPLISPPASPDLNIIENCWGLVDDKLMGRSFPSLQAFKTAVRNEWANLSMHTVQQLFDSMPKRVAKLLKCHGGHIERNVYS